MKTVMHLPGVAMNEPPLAQQLKEAEAAIAEAERRLGPDHPELAEKLQKYAALLRKTEKRTLDAVNIEARAKAIRAKMYAEEERAHGTTTITVVKPPEKQSNAGMFIGLAGILCALSGLFINQEFLKFLLPLALILAVADVVIARSGFWRATMVVVFAISAWCANQSVPDKMLVDATPIDRFNYASEYPEIVSYARKLGKPVTVLGYSLCLPEGFNGPNDMSGDWGRAFVWQGPAHADTTTPQMVLMLVKLPEDLAKRGGNFSVMKAARDIAVPKLCEVLNLADCTQEQAQMEEINGLEFAHFPLKARGQFATTGFAYVAANKLNLVVLAATDETPFSQDSLPPLEASVYTFCQQRR